MLHRCPTGWPGLLFPWSTPRRSRGCWAASQVLVAATREHFWTVAGGSDRTASADRRRAVHPQLALEPVQCRRPAVRSERVGAAAPARPRSRVEVGAAVGAVAPAAEVVVPLPAAEPPPGPVGLPLCLVGQPEGGLVRRPAGQRSSTRSTAASSSRGSSGFASRFSSRARSSARAWSLRTSTTRAVPWRPSPTTTGPCSPSASAARRPPRTRRRSLPTGRRRRRTCKPRTGQYL